MEQPSGITQTMHQWGRKMKLRKMPCGVLKRALCKPKLRSRAEGWRRSFDGMAYMQLLSKAL